MKPLVRHRAPAGLRRCEAGASAVEFALIAPVMLMLMMQIFNLGQMIYGKVLLGGRSSRRRGHLRWRPPTLPLLTRRSGLSSAGYWRARQSPARAPAISISLTSAGPSAGTTSMAMAIAAAARAMSTRTAAAAGSAMSAPLAMAARAMS